MHDLPHPQDEPAGLAASPDEAAASAGIEKYLADVAHIDLPVAQKIELLEALAAIMQNFVDRAFGEDPVQQARAEGKSSGKDASRAAAMVDLGPTTTPDNSNKLANVFGRSSPADAEGESDRFHD
jgi:hypothetical protein